METQSRPSTGTPGPETPFQIVVLGDFSGRGGQPHGEASQPLARRRPIHVHRENLDGVMARLGVQCEASIGDQENHVVALRFQRLGDFHPNHLFATTPIFARLKQLHEKLQSPANFEKAAEEVRSWGLLEKGERRDEPKARSASKQPAADPIPPRHHPSANLLDTAIDQTEEDVTASPPRAGTSALVAKSASQPARLPDELAEIVRRAVEPYRIEKADPDQADLLGCVEAVASQLMRSILHDPRFQALEAAWRGLDFLLRRLSTGPKLKVFLIDVSLAELAADFGAANDLESSSLHRLLVDETVGTLGAAPWGAIVGNFTFDAESLDLLLAGCVARIAARAGAPFLAAGSPALIGCTSRPMTADPEDWQSALPDRVRAAWNKLRAMREASYLGLALPRFLLRMPYGAETSPIESFSFEELPDPAEHESYLWGNPAFACAFLLGQAFDDGGWRPTLRDVAEIDDLPAYGYEYDGEYRLQPCTETLLSQRAANRILDEGIMPLLGVKGQGAARLAAWRSVAAGEPRFLGRWFGE